MEVIERLPSDRSFEEHHMHQARVVSRPLLDEEYDRFEEEEEEDRSF